MEFIKHTYVVNPCCSSPAPFAPVGMSAPVSLADHSSVIEKEDVSQLVMEANANRKYLFIQNASTKDLWINFSETAVRDQPSIKLMAGGTFVMENFVSTESINVIGNKGQGFVAKEG